MSPTTRSARVGAGARAPVSSGTPMETREVSVAPLPDGSWVVKPRAGTVPPRRTRPRKDYSGLFTPLADALEHGPGNSCVSHDPGFIALRDNLRVHHRAVYRGAVATASAAVDDEETLAPHHEPSAQPADEPHVHSIPAHSCDHRDENSDPALLGTVNAMDADTDAHCDAARVHQDTEKTTGRVTVETEFPNLYALPEDTEEDPRLAPAEVLGTGATAVYPSLESEDRQWKTPAPPRHHASLAIPPSTVRGGGDGFGFGTSLKTPRATVPLSLNDDQLFSPLESERAMYGVGTLGYTAVRKGAEGGAEGHHTNIGGGVHNRGLPRDFALDVPAVDSQRVAEEANYFQNLARRTRAGLHAPSPGMFAPGGAIQRGGADRSFMYPSPATFNKTPVPPGGVDANNHTGASRSLGGVSATTPLGGVSATTPRAAGVNTVTPAPRRYIQLDSELQAPISTRGTRPKIAAASRLAKEAGDDVDSPGVVLGGLSPVAWPVGDGDKNEAGDGAAADVTINPNPKSGAGGFTFESGAGVHPLDSPAGGFGGFKFAEPSPSPSPAGGIFQTASGKNVTPSADAMRRARGMFEDDTAEFRFNPACGGDERRAQLPGGGIFQTASGKGVAVSADAVRIARRWYLGDDTESTPQGDAPGFKFHTASGKEVTPSARARARGENLFGSVGTRSGPEDTALKKRKVDGSTPACADITPGGGSGGLFQTGTGRAVTVSEDGMRRARSLLGQTTTSTAEAVPMEAALTPVPAAATDIFSTANGKSVAVSRAAMQRGARLFNNEGDISGDISGGERDATTPAREPPARAASNAAPKPALQTGAKGTGGFKPPARTKQFNPPIRQGGNGARTPPNASPGGRGLATKHTGAGAGAAPQVHDLFASRVDRERLGSFFDYLKPGERPGVPSALLDAQVRAMSADTALGYRVHDETRDVVYTPEDVRVLMIKERGCVERLLDADWCLNAYRWTVWTQSCVARSFPDVADAIAASCVIDRMVYRYEREILRAQRPWVRRVLERDTPAKSPVVLCVAAVRRSGAKDGCAHLELTDGWYGIHARCDRYLTEQLRLGVLFIGQKVLVQGAELKGIDEPCGPLSDAARTSAHLALHANGVRPARWDAHLGPRRRVESIPLRTLRSDGGVVGKTIVYVERVYPGSWIETDFATGRKVHRNDAGESIARDRWERARDAELDRIQSRGVPVSEDAAREMLRTAGLLERNARRATRLRVSGVKKLLPGSRVAEGYTGAALLTAYDLPHELVAVIKEGCVYELNNVMCGRSFVDQNGGLELTCGRHTRWRRLQRPALAKARLAPSPTPRRLTDAAALGTSADGVVTGGEFDVVAVLLHVSAPQPPAAPRSQWAFLATASSAEDETVGGDLLAVEIDARSPETFVGAADWGAGHGWSLDGGGSRLRSPIIRLDNLTYVSTDATNGLKVAKCTELTRVQGAEGGADTAVRWCVERLKGWIGSVDAAGIIARVRRLTDAPGGGSSQGTRENVVSKELTLPGGSRDGARASVGGDGWADGWSLSQARAVEEAAMAEIARKREEAAALKAAGLDDDDEVGDGANANGEMNA